MQMQLWAIILTGVFGTALLGACIYGAVEYNKPMPPSPTPAQLKQVQKPTYFNYMSCISTKCQQVCDHTDFTCKGAVTKYENCYLNDKACVAWQSDQQQIQSSDTMSDDYYTCDTDCRPDSSSNFYQIYMCKAECAGIPAPTATAMLQASATTQPDVQYFDYFNCFTTKCHGKACDPTDADCLAASTEYQGCIAANVNCTNWSDEQAELSSNDPVPSDYYVCEQSCRPDSSSNYYGIHMCEAGCAGVKTTSLKASSVPTYYQYENCLETSCHGLQCNSTDTTCFGSAIKYQNCYLKDSACVAWQKDQQTLQTDSPMPADWFNCDKDCRPAKGDAFYDIYSCAAKCGGIMA